MRWSSYFGRSWLGCSCLLPGNDLPLGQYSWRKVEGPLSPFSFGFEVFCPLKYLLARVNFHVVWHGLLCHHFTTGGAGWFLALVLLLLVVIQALLSFEQLPTVRALKCFFSCTLHSPFMLPEKMWCTKNFVAQFTFKFNLLSRPGNKFLLVFVDSMWGQTVLVICAIWAFLAVELVFLLMHGSDMLLEWGLAGIRSIVTVT